MLGSSPTGIGVYAEHCARFLERHFACTVVSSQYIPGSQRHIQSPENIVIGASRRAPFKRIFYLWKGFPKVEGLVYTPTHHGIIGRGNQIITILDLIPLRFPSQHRFQYYYFKCLLPKIMRGCPAVFTISESVKKEINAYYNFPMEKIHVVPCGLDQEKYSPASSANHAERAYLLVVGAAYLHKNIHEILQNCELWRKHYSLKIVGSRGTYREYLRKLVVKYHLSDSVEFSGYLSDPMIVKLMQGCKALIYPSLCEGFGMPPLEVMACGRPVIVSNISVHKEIFADVPIYITPGNKKSWENAFTFLENKSLIDERIVKGLDLVKLYTWRRSGEILADTLGNIMAELDKQAGYK